MQRIITAPAAAYIVFVGTEDEYRSFISLNAKTSYLFDKKVVFPDLSNDEIVDIYEKCCLPLIKISLLQILSPQL